MSMNARRVFSLGILGLWALGNAGRAAAQDAPPEIPPSLDTVPVPPVPGIDDFIQDRTAAIALGKALFWDTATGSDGQACASCHFQAGADNRDQEPDQPGHSSHGQSGVGKHI